ncbi:MAG: serine/threonine-protein kinase, partial [Planctomycetaceae bacterium]
MPVTTLDEFWQKIVAANLLSPEEVSRFRRDDSGERADETPLPQAVAERLVKAGALTGWQANMLLAGQDRFFLGRYKLLEKLGEGGMGSVFKAEQVPLGRIVALKVMSEKLVSSAGSVARFRREIQSAAALQHPHIVLAYDADCVGDVHFLVMEYVDGEDLARLVKRRGALPAGEACHYVVQAAEGLDHAHRRGMVHRDIKPGNLLLTSRGVHPREQDGGDQPRRSPTPSGSPGGIIKILDFGLAKLEEQSETAHDLTATGQVLGTPDYMAPEQARNTRDADVRSDVYALGCTLFRLIGGRVPFPEGNVMERLMAKAMDDAPRLKSLRPEIPDALDAVVAKMLSRDPDQRYQTPAEVAAALTPFAERPQQAGTIVSATRRGGWNIAGSQGTGLESATDVEPAYARFLDLLTREADEDATQATGSAQLAETIAEPADGGDAALLEDLRPRQRRPERPPGRGARSTKVQRELAARSRKDRRRLRRMASVAVAFTAVIAGLALWHKTGETQFVTDWSADDLNVVTLKVDGREQSFTGTQQLVYRGRPGRYQLMLRRDGYHDIDRTWTLTRGESVTFRPEWKPTAATIRKSELAALKKRVDDYVQARRRTHASRGVHPPGNNGGDRGDEPRGSRGDAQIAKLRSDLLAFRRRYYDKLDDCLTVAQLMSRLPWPADQLQRKDIDPYELQAAEFATAGAAASRGVHPPGNNGAA